MDVEIAQAEKHAGEMEAKEAQRDDYGPGRGSNRTGCQDGADSWQAMIASDSEPDDSDISQHLHMAMLTTKAV